MIKQAVNIDTKSIPHWAEKYLNHYNVLFVLQIIKKPKRQMAFDLWKNDDEYKSFNKEYKIVETSNVIYCNKKGEVVFYWDSAKDKTAFFLKWA